MYLEHLFFFDSDSTVAEGLGRDISKILTFQIKTYRFIIYNRFMNTYLVLACKLDILQKKPQGKKTQNSRKNFSNSRFKLKFLAALRNFSRIPIHNLNWKQRLRNRGLKPSLLVYIQTQFQIAPF